MSDRKKGVKRTRMKFTVELAILLTILVAFAGVLVLNQNTSITGAVIGINEDSGGISLEDIGIQAGTDCDQTISACKFQNWTQNTVYCLDTDISNQVGNCMSNLNASVTFDCQGRIIDGDDSGTDFGIRTDNTSNSFSYQNITIKNCIVTDFSSGIRIAAVNESLITNVSLSSNTLRGIYLDSDRSTNNVTVQYSTIFENSDTGIYGEGAVSNITIFNNTIKHHFGAGDNGIELPNTGQDNWNISWNYIAHNANGISTPAGSFGMIENNLFINNSAGVLFGSATTNHTFRSNQFNDSRSEALTFSDTQMDHFFIDNTINGYAYVHCYANNSFRSDHQVTETNRVTGTGAANIFQCHNAIINNLTVSHHQTGGSGGLNIVDSSGVVVDNSSFFNNTRGVVFSTSLNGVRNAIFRSNNFTRNTQSGLLASSATNITFFNNIFNLHDGNGDSGISQNNNNDRWNISLNNFTHNAMGIDIGTTSNIRTFIENNIFLNQSTEGGISLGGDNNFIRGNFFLNNTQALVFSSTGINNSLSDNQFNDSVTRALVFNSILAMNQSFSNNLVNGYEYTHCNSNSSFRSDHKVIGTDRVSDFGAANIFQCNNAIINNITISAHQAQTGSIDGRGLFISDSDNVTVNNSTFINNSYGIWFDNSNNNVDYAFISNSNFTNNTVAGIRSSMATFATIYHNLFTRHDGTNDQGILFSNDNKHWNISFNNFTFNSEGIDHGPTRDVNISYFRNTFHSNIDGMNLQGDNNTIWENNFINNSDAIVIASGAINSTIYRNNFKNRTNSTSRHVVAGTGNEFNISFVPGAGGNFWDDYDTSAEGCNDANSDGFCDAPRNSTIDSAFTGQDNHPYVSTISFEADAAAPSVTIVNPANGSNFSAVTQAFNATVTDIESSVSTVLFMFNTNATPFNVTAVNRSGNWGTLVNLSVFPEGLHSAIAFANDTFNNINQSVNISFIVDLTAPNATPNNPLNGRNYSAGLFPRFSFNISDNVTEVQTALIMFNTNTTPFNRTLTNDSGSWGSASIPTSSFVEGHHTVTLYTNDTVGNINNTVNISFTVDKTNPNVSFIYPTNASNFSAETVGFNLSLFDNTTEIQTALLIFNTNATPFNKSLTNNSGNWSTIVNFSDFPEGLHIAVAYVNDTVGNLNNTVNISFTVDRTTPNVIILAPLNYSNFSAETVGFNFSILDNVTEPQTAILIFNTNATPFNKTLINSSGNWSTTVNFSDFPEGLHVAVAYVNDTVGNLNQTVNISFIVDRTAPNLTFITPTNGSNFSAGSSLFNVSISENVTEVQSALLIFNTNATPFNKTLTNNSGYWSITVNFADFPEGLHSAVTYVNDSAGNLNQTVNISFTIDRTAPNVSFIYPANASNFSAETVGFNLSLLDNVTQIQTALLIFNTNVTPFNKTLTNNSGNWSTAVNFSDFPEGLHSAVAYVNDTVGNFNDTVNISFIVDKTAPNASRNSLNGRNYSDNSAPRFSFNISDNVTEVQTALVMFNTNTTPFNRTLENQTGTWTSASISTSSLTEGVHFATLFVNDTVGNINNTVNISFTVDFTAPNVTINYNFVDNSNFSLRTNNRTFNASVFDALLDVGTVSFWFNNGTGTDFNATAINQSGNWIVSYNISALAEGRQGAVVVANDTVNNVNNTQFINFTVDRTAPAVTITSPLNGATVSGIQSFQATISDAFTDVNTVFFMFSNGTNPFNRTATNNSGTWSVTIDTSIAPDGLNTVTVFANDTVDNVNNTQSISVTISNAVVVETPAAPGGGGGGGTSAGPTLECTSTVDCAEGLYCVQNKCLKIFDLKIIQADSPVPPGEYLDFTYFIKAVAEIYGDVTLDFWLEQDGTTFTTSRDVIYVGSFEEKVDTGSVFLPTTLPDGNYLLNARLTFEEYVIESNKQIEVKKDVPLIPMVTILPLRPIAAGTYWNYTAIVAVNKDEPTHASVERKVTRDGENVWLKESGINLQRSAILIDVVTPLAADDYVLELTATVDDKTARAAESFRVEGAAEPLVGGAIGLFGALKGIWSFIIAFLLLLLIIILLIWLRRKKGYSFDQVDTMAQKMILANEPEEKVKTAISRKGMSEKQLKILSARIAAVKRLNAKVRLNWNDLQDLQRYIKGMIKEKYTARQVAYSLIKEGWPEAEITPYIMSHYK